MDHRELLDSMYEQVMGSESCHNLKLIDSCADKQLGTLISASENNKAVVTVLITLLAHKILHQDQDIRRHQEQIPGGFAGRTIDTKYITPFMKAHGFPSMAASGWLTRSLEHSSPYDMNYGGNIRPESVKKSFLGIIDKVESGDVSAEMALRVLLSGLIAQRDSAAIELAKPHDLDIYRIINLLKKHFSHKYMGHGAARLPVLALHAIYGCLMKSDRYRGKVLCDLESHTSADRRSGRIGDIDVMDENGNAFEGVEVKHDIVVTPTMVHEAYLKFMSHKTTRYYILTTANMDSADWAGINTEISKIKQIHGCQVIVNGVYTTLTYYLRVIADPADFIDKYVELMKCDQAIKYSHKAVWNEIISTGNF